MWCVIYVTYVCMYTCMQVQAHSYMCIYTYMHVEARNWHLVSSIVLHLCFLRHGLLLNLELTDTSRLASQ